MTMKVMMIVIVIKILIAMVVLTPGSPECNEEFIIPRALTIHMNIHKILLVPII